MQSANSPSFITTCEEDENGDLVLNFPDELLKRWVGRKERALTSMPLATESCCEKYNQRILKQLNELRAERTKLEEEILLLHSEIEKVYDV